MEHIFELYKEFNSIIGVLIAFTIGLGVLGFMWGIVKLIFNLSNPSAKQEAKSYMLYGLIVLFVMTSVWGIVNILTETLTTAITIEE
jgi:hypothetical protein